MIKSGLTLAAIVLLSGCGSKVAAPEQTVQQFMAKDVQPTAQTYWDAVQYVSDETGNHDILPQTDADWQKVKDAATKLVGYADLLKTPAYSDGRGDDWQQFANSLSDVAKQAEAAAAEKNPDKIFEVGGTMYSVCSACHMVYPATTGPEAEAAAAAAASSGPAT
ncbi:MAG: hypothetical protein ABIT16_01345 [Croceibacterium sp.]